MVDYSKFANIDASDSEEEEQKLRDNAQKGEAWLRKYDAMTKDLSSSDSDSDAEPTIAGVDWAKEGAEQLGPDKYDATLQKRDGKLKNAIPGDATWLTPTERRRLMRHSSPGSTGARFAGEQLQDVTDASQVPAALAKLKDPWPSVDATQLYAHARVAKKLDPSASARLREDLASRTHLRLALARYFIKHEVDATGANNRAACEGAVDACWEAVREAAAGETEPWDAAWADGPLACAALVLAEPGMRPLLLAPSIKRVGCETLLAISRGIDRRDELLAAWRQIEPDDADAVEVFVEPAGATPSYTFQPLLQSDVADNELGPYITYARHAGLPKYGTLALCLTNALRRGIQKLDGAARRASILRASLDPALEQVLGLETDDADDVATWVGYGVGLQNTLRGFLVALAPIGRFFDGEAITAHALLEAIPDKNLGYEPLQDPIFGHAVDTWLAGEVPLKDGVLAARGDRHGRVLRGWASALRGAAVSAIAAVGSDYGSICDVPDEHSWPRQEVQLALSVRGWLFVATRVEKGRFTIEFEKGSSPAAKDAIPCLHAMRELVKEGRLEWPQGLADVSLVAVRFRVSPKKTVTALALSSGDDAIATLGPDVDDAVILVDVCDGQLACACCGTRATKRVALHACAGCHRVAYCSRKCQAKAWKRGHRKLCPRLAGLTRENSPPPSTGALT